MNITDVNFRKFKGNDKVLGFASVTIDNAIVITGIRVIAGQYGIFLGFPSRQDSKTKEWHEIVFPKSKEARQTILDAVKQEVGIDGSEEQPTKHRAPFDPEPGDDDFF